MARVFLSYARADRPRVSELAAALERAGHDVWWDRRLSGGAEFEHQIEQALADADVVVVVWSVASVRSHWVRDEAAAGRDRDRLVPVSLDGSAPPLGFRQLHTIDVTAWKKDSSCCCPQVEDAVEATMRGNSGLGRQ
jgi:hypothetical protein